MSSKSTEVGYPKFAIVPARGGSKRVVDKNIRQLNGRTLIERAIDASLGASLSVIFSSDSERYCEFVESRYQGSVEIDCRPPELATDTVKVVEVVRRIIDSKSLADNEFFSMLLPTSPFRGASLVRNIVEKTVSDKCGYFSAVAYDFPVQFGFTIDDRGTWYPLFGDDSPMKSGNTRSQDQGKCLHPTGGFYSQNAGIFRTTNSLYHHARAFEVDQMEAFDIDTEIDFRIASALAGELDL